MKKLIVLIFCFTCFSSIAQDLLVISPNDSLNVKITAENKENKVLFVYSKNQEIIIDSVDFNNVKSIVKNFFAQKVAQLPCKDTIFTKENDTIVCTIFEDKKDWYISYFLNGKSKQNIGYYSVLKVVRCKNSTEKLITPQNIKPLIDSLKHKRVRLSASYLFSYRIFKMPGGISNIERKMYEDIRNNNGFQAEFQIAVDKKRMIFLGANYISLNAESSQDNIILTTNSGSQYSGSLIMNTSIKTFGPNVLVRFNEKSSVHNFSIQMGLNLSVYQESLKIGGFNFSVNGFGFSTNYHFIYEYQLNPNLSFLAYTGIVTGNVTEVEINDNGKLTKRSLSGEEVINTSRIPLGLGLSFKF